MRLHNLHMARLKYAGNKPENWNIALHFIGVLFGQFAVPILVLSALNKNLFLL